MRSQLKIGVQNYLLTKLGKQIIRERECKINLSRDIRFYFTLLFYECWNIFFIIQLMVLGFSFYILVFRIILERTRRNQRGNLWDSWFMYSSVTWTAQLICAFSNYRAFYEFFKRFTVTCSYLLGVSNFLMNLSRVPFSSWHLL